MDQSICKLTLVYPTSGEDRLIELMLESDPPLTGFTTLAADGHGHDFADATIAERVRGRVKRGVLVAVMTRNRAERLLGEIQDKAAIPHLAYWIEPVTAFGRLAPVALEPGVSSAISAAAC